LGTFLDPLNAVEACLQLSLIDALIRSTIIKLQAFTKMVRLDGLEQRFAIAEVQESRGFRHLGRLCALTEAEVYV
jgi:hypothetical protein